MLPSKRYRPVDRESGQTNCIKQLNATLRQRISRLVRKTWSFSKKGTTLIDKKCSGFQVYYNSIMLMYSPFRHIGCNTISPQEEAMHTIRWRIVWGEHGRRPYPSAILILQCCAILVQRFKRHT
jgi:hypothetical protein